MSKTAVVTGASGGIGLEFARLLALDGYDLVLVARSEERLSAIQKEFEEKYKIKVRAFAKDLSLTNSAKDVFESVRDVPEVLINNAGVGLHGDFSASEWERDAEMINLNIFSLVDLTRLFLPGMMESKRGMIVNLASTAAFEPGPLMSVYYASKAFVLSFSLALREELKGSGVTVTALCPGPTATGFQAAAGTTGTRLHTMMPVQSAAQAAKAGFDGMKKGKAYVIPGFFNSLAAFMARFAPYAVIVPMVKRMNSKQ